MEPKKADLWAGALLMASAPVDFALPEFALRGLLSAALFSGGLVLLALGGGISRNLLNGERLGTSAMLGLAGWSLAVALIEMLWVDVPQTPIGVAGILDFCGLAIALVVVVQIGRARHLPAGWRWAPAWALLAQSVAVVVTLVVLVGATDVMNAAPLATGFATFVRAIVPIFLGALAVALSFTTSFVPSDAETQATLPPRVVR